MTGFVSGKVAIVTGGGRGIGRAIAMLMAKEGASVVVVDIGASLDGMGTDQGPAQEVVGEIAAKGGKAIASTLSITEPQNAEAIVKSAIDTFGRVDILVNNAGIATNSMRTHEYSVADWDRLMAINLRGVFLTTRKALALMLPGPGSIINISSILGLRGFWPGSPAGSISYSAAKAGVIGFTRQVAAEYAKEKIRSNAIAPGWHGGTALGAERRAASTADDVRVFEEAIHARIAMKHRGVPDDLVGLVIYLASDASHYVTGQVIAHDGGWDGVVA